MKNSFQIITACLTLALTSLSTDTFAQENSFSFAYVSVQGKEFSKKLKVVVDLGDTPKQINSGEEYSESLNNKKSYAAILNYLVDNQFELVDTIVLHESYSYQGTGSGGISGIVFIMKKKKN